jgi:uncharacterized protein (DUF433 family)
MSSITDDAIRLPLQLREEAARLAAQQGVSLAEFILWIVAEKVSALRTPLDDAAFPGITYRRGGSGAPAPVLRGHGLRVKTIVVAAKLWNETPAQIAEEYSIPETRVQEALAFYQAHRWEIDTAIRLEEMLENSHA